MPKFLLLAVFFVFTSAAFGQTPTPPKADDDDQPEQIFTEEVKLNIFAVGKNGEFATDVRREDLVIDENNILHQADSVRRLPANVLVMLDTGGEMRLAKDIDQTKATAGALIEKLDDKDSVAILQYNDKAEIIVEWTNKANGLKQLNEKLNFGRRSVFIDALELATEFLKKSPVENRHLVLISDGTDSFNDAAERQQAVNRLLASSISVHVISYTALEREKIEPRAKNTTKNPLPKALPPEVAQQLPNGARDMATAPNVGPTIVTDKKFLNTMRARKQSLIDAEKFMSDLSSDTNGEFILPADTEEMIEKTALVARVIDANYVITYTPKRPLNEAKADEIRTIQVTSKRDGLEVQAKRKLFVAGAQ